MPNYFLWVLFIEEEFRLLDFVEPGYIRKLTGHLSSPRLWKGLVIRSPDEECRKRQLPV